MHINQLFDLTGRVAIVTGGAGNYGKCIVEGLLEAGATVVVSSRNVDAATSELQAHFGNQERWKVMALDQQYPDSIRSFLSSVKNQYQKLDIFINNAVARPMKGYAGDMDQFRESMEINATGMFHLLRGISD